MIYEILQEGAENATTGREICDRLNLTIRELQAAQTILNNAEKFTNRLDREEHQANIIQNPLDDMFL